MSGTEDSRSVPRAMVHRRVLDVARDNPGTPIEELAPMVSGATPGMVRRVFEEYGDPCVESTGTDSPHSDHSTAPSTSDSATSTDDPLSDPESERITVVDEEISEEQLRTLRAVYDHPAASQRTLAEILDVSPSTVCHRLNQIDGFAWENRWHIVTALFDDSTSDANGDDPELVARLDRLEERLDSLEESRPAVFADPDLAHRIVRASMNADDISRDEELAVVKAVIGEH